MDDDDGAPAVRVVVIDDDDDTREVLEACLRARDVEVRAFGDGDEALASIEADVPDVVMLDLRLRGRSGEEIARALRMRSGVRHAALIAMSGVVDPEWHVVQYFDAYLRKPIDPEFMIDLVFSLRELRHRSPRTGATTPWHR